MHAGSAVVIRIEASITKAQYAKLHLRLLYRRPGIWVLNLLGLASAVLIVALQLGLVSGMDVGGAWIWPVFAIALPIVVVRAAFRELATNRFLAGKTVYEVGEDGVRAQGPTMECMLQWPSFLKFVELPGWILLFVSEHGTLPLPIATIDVNTAHDVRVLVHQRVPPEKPGKFGGWWPLLLWLLLIIILLAIWTLLTPDAPKRRHGGTTSVLAARSRIEPRCEWVLTKSFTLRSAFSALQIA